jgi:hypothetical protein
VLYPPPHPAFLKLHYFTSISKAMKGSGDVCELDDDDEAYELSENDEDYEEHSEMEELKNEQVRIWLDSSSSGRAG